MDPLLTIGDEVAETLNAGGPVVAIETSVIGQGLPSPRNVECLERMATAIRAAGAVPAWIGVLGGHVVVGSSDRELAALAEPGRADKVARRDLPAAIARGGPGATTVSAAIWAAGRAGIHVSTTGGIGGVHPGDHPDVSADLVELSRTPGLLVCSGPKSIVDPVATAERLEELGVTIVGFGTDVLPGFLAAATSVEVEHRVDTVEEAAAILDASLALETSSTVVLCNPIAAAWAMDPDEVAAATRACERRAARDGVRGRALTPFLLACLAEETDGRSLEANLGLLEANASLAARIASARAGSSLSRVEPGTATAAGPSSTQVPPSRRAPRSRRRR